MSAAPTREAILTLYHNMLKTSQSFSSYNFRNYFVKRTKDQFRVLQVRRKCSLFVKSYLNCVQEETDPEKVRALYSDAVKESTVLRRSAIVNQLYGGWTLAVEAQDAEKRPESIKERADT